MKNLWNFIKDKSYYFLGGTIIIIILLIIISSCSGGNGSSYEEIENKMVIAAKNYYKNRKEILPKQNGDIVKVTISTLVESELLKEVKDPKDSSNSCSGYVEVTKIEDDYSFVPFLTCEGNYEPKYLKDVIKNEKTDELGNGVYSVGNSFIYRGEELNNYVLFNDLLWRIVKVDDNGDIKLVLATYTQDIYPWDTKYNPESGYNSGNTTDYLLTDIRKTLNAYFEETFTKENKAKIVSKNICIGKYLITDDFSIEKECSIIKENEKISLLNPSDYQMASLDNGCTNLNSMECINRNYLSDGNIFTWTLNPLAENTYKVIYIYDSIGETYANNSKRLNPVIYLSSKVIINQGDGTFDNPYKIK